MANPAHLFVDRNIELSELAFRAGAILAAAVMVRQSGNRKVFDISATGVEAVLSPGEFEDDRGLPLSSFPYVLLVWGERRVDQARQVFSALRDEGGYRLLLTDHFDRKLDAVGL